MKRVFSSLVILLLLLMMVVPFVSVSATPISPPATTEEEPPAQEETEKPAQEQPAGTGEALTPATGETTDSTTTLEEEKSKQADDINPCLLDPSDPVCPKPDPITQDCPEGYAQNEDGNCFLLHPEGCPQGYHGHEDDETGRCIPNTTPCDPLYILVTGEGGRKNCERKEFYCQSHGNDNRCGSKDNGNDQNNGNGNSNNNKKHVDIKVIEQENEKNSDSLDNIQKTIIAISYDQGKGINCVVDDDNDGKCETFDVTVDKGKEPLLQIIDFD